MKKILTVLILFASAISVPMQAQIHFGLKGGLNVNHISSSNKTFGDIMKNKAGWTLGIMAEYMIPTLPIGVDAALMFQRLNSEMEYVVASDDNTGQLINRRYIGRDFIILPINMKWKIGIPVLSSFMKPMLLTGPEFSLRMNRKIIGEISEKGTSMAWNIGIGAELINHIQFTILYGIPLTKNGTGIIPNENLVPVSYKNHVWNINLAFLF